MKVSKMTMIRIERDETKLMTVVHYINLCNVFELDIFEMVEASQMKLNNVNVYNLLKNCDKLFYKDADIDKEQLENLINESLKL